MLKVGMATVAATAAVHHLQKSSRCLGAGMTNALAGATSPAECALLKSLPFAAQCGPDADTIQFLYASKMKKVG